ncbi:hypothetical protein THA_284 [Thermosipho africanus TCF52B]|uniref:Lipoprotein n=1 Tax=Thermosipho africanus (strain TCF52B) TaxID=484019 RepID=B7IFC0_THEAB|nr:hypothetical protein [Thermosipho africanus]ACJ74784.1 hypothetical protein THA_284 [Thermosipho africanus TCF52B]
MRKLLTLMLSFLLFSFFFAEEVIFDGNISVKFSVDSSPKLSTFTTNNFMYVGVKGKSYFIGFLSQNSTYPYMFTIDQAYGIFNFGFANIFLGTKIQNFRVSTLGNDLWLGGNISTEIPFEIGSLYVAIDSNFSDSDSPKVNVLSLNLNLENLIIVNSVFYNNYSNLETGIEIPYSNSKILGYFKYDILNSILKKLTFGFNTKIEKADLTLSFTPDVSNFQSFEIDLSGLYTLNNNYQFGSKIDYNSKSSNINLNFYSNYKYNDILVVPSISWENKNPYAISGALELSFNF